MKTKTFLLLCLFLGIGLTRLPAQNRVSKYAVTVDMGGQYFPCTGEYLWGAVTIENLLSSNNWITKVRDAVIYGTDEFGNPTGNVYELSQTSPGLNFSEATGTFRLNGKVIGIVHWSYHTTTNANGDVTVDRYIVDFNCK